MELTAGDEFDELLVKILSVYAKHTCLSPAGGVRCHPPDSRDAIIGRDLEARITNWNVGVEETAGMERR